MTNFLLGFGIGLTVGVLFAPKSGGETREYLGARASEGSDYLANQAQQLKESASGLVDKGRNILADQKDKLTNAAQGAAQGAEKAYQS